jgi:LysM repeat protein
MSNINTELLSADARGRKSIPFAVFAVIFIHIALFLILLIAAGCRAKARARRNAIHQQEIARAATKAAPAAPSETRVSRGATELEQPVIATEPVVETTPEAQELRASGIVKQPARPARPTASVSRGIQMHTVRQGDTVGKIAHQYGVSIQVIKSENHLKTDLIHVGQKLRVNLDKAREKQTLAAL